MHPGDSGCRQPADFAVKPGGATFNDLQDVQFAGEQGLLGGSDGEACTRGQLLYQGDKRIIM